MTTNQELRVKINGMSTIQCLYRAYARQSAAIRRQTELSARGVSRSVYGSQRSMYLQIVRRASHAFFRVIPRGKAFRRVCELEKL